MKKGLWGMLTLTIAGVIAAGSIAATGNSAGTEDNKFLSGTKVLEAVYTEEKAFDSMEYTTVLGELSGNITSEGMVLTESQNKAAILKIFDYAASSEENSAYTIVLRGSMNSPVSDLDESKNMFGIAYNIQDGNNFCYAVIRSSQNFDINRQKDGLWQSGPGYTTGNGSTRNRLLSVFDYTPDTEYEIIIRAYSDGKIRLILDGAVSYDIADNFREGTGIGIYLRNTEATVNYLAVYADAANSSEDDQPGDNAFGNDESDSESVSSDTQSSVTEKIDTNTEKVSESTVKAEANNTAEETTSADSVKTDDKKGCKASVTAASVALVACVCSASVIIGRKKHD